MKRHRRVEITAFQRKVTIVSGEFQAYCTDPDPCPSKELLDSVSPDSDEGRQILSDAVRLLNDRLTDSLSPTPGDETAVK